MKPPKLALAFALAACIAIAGCATPVGPIEVTRFSVPDAARFGGPIAIEPAPGMDRASLEYRSYAAAVARELVRVGYSEQVAGSAPQVAQVTLERRSYQPGRNGSPVSVGMGGSTGSYGGGVGLGIGIDLSGPPPEQVETQLSVMIRDHATGQSLWEGRAAFTVKASSPLAGTQLGAAKMAEALFRNFPGRSGETIRVAP